MKPTCVSSRKARQSTRNMEAAQQRLTSLAHLNAAIVKIIVNVATKVMVLVLDSATADMMASATERARDIGVEAVVVDLKIATTTVTVTVIVTVTSAIGSMSTMNVRVRQATKTLTILTSATVTKLETSLRTLRRAEHSVLLQVIVAHLKLTHVSVIITHLNNNQVNLEHNSVQASQLQQGATIATAQAIWHVTARSRQGVEERIDDALPHLHRDHATTRDSVRL